MSWKNTEEGMRRNTLLHERGLKKHVAYIRRAVRFTAAGRIEGESAHNFRCGRSSKDCADRTFPRHGRRDKIIQESVRHRKCNC